MNIHTAFKVGAKRLAKDSCQYTELHKQHGIEEHHWNLITSKEPWTPDQTRQMRSLIAAVCEVSMTIAGMPAIPFPGQYVAAVIAEVVSPINRILAATKAPDTFDAVAASGLIGTHQIKDMSVQQLIALTMAYSGGYPEEPHAHKLPDEIAEQMAMENERGDKKPIQRNTKPKEKIA